jgi:hypothetical protein
MGTGHSDSGNVESGRSSSVQDRSEAVQAELDVTYSSEEGVVPVVTIQRPSASKTGRRLNRVAQIERAIPRED